VRTERGLLECDYGSWTGRELKTLAKEGLWKTVQMHPSAAQFPEGESMTAMSSRAVGAVRRWDAAVEAEHGPHAVWVAVSHGDVIKAILADALGLHLDAFQRIVVDPASLSVVRYTPGRPFVVTMNTAAGDLSHLRPPARKGRRRKVSSDAAVGGGAGGGTTP
jgi:probable phosphomutase (TIGR03848 family)